MARQLNVELVVAGLEAAGKLDELALWPDLGRQAVTQT